MEGLFQQPFKQKSRARARLLVHARSNRHYSDVALAADFLRGGGFFLAALPWPFLAFLALLQPLAPLQLPVLSPW